VLDGPTVCEVTFLSSEKTDNPYSSEALPLSHQVLLEQPSFPGFCVVTDAVETLARSSVESRGAIYTRREVVDFILDLVGYTDDQNLASKSLLEPSFGAGDFLLPAVERLMSSLKGGTQQSADSERLKHCIRAVELNRDAFEKTRADVLALLFSHGFNQRNAQALVESWLIGGDFLLAPLTDGFDFVVGNPPYVRQELIPEALLAVYRKRFSTLFDRADLYVPFIERSLRLLAAGGQLSFICADRWMKNRYGGPLRELVAKDFHLRIYVDMTGTPAFHSEVAAYPAITVIGREMPGPTRVAERPPIEAVALKELASHLRAEGLGDTELVRELSGVVIGAEPWVLHASDKTDLVRRIEAAYPSIEEVGCKVGIGVATGADKAYIGKLAELDVEPDRKLPIVMTRDISTGRVDWRGYGVINPFTDEGTLVDLRKFPKLQRYLEDRRAEIGDRHVARKSPANWYRTIDRITPSLAARPKLLIPDIKGEAQVVFEEGMLYPHHNLYFVISDAWDLKALQAVLLSKLTRLFIETYSTKMRGGFLRFQAQYLRRIRLPGWEDVSAELRRRLVDAAERLDMNACDEATALLYKLTPGEIAALETP
jgi:hypothetical protein